MSTGELFRLTDEEDDVALRQRLMLGLHVLFNRGEEGDGDRPIDFDPVPVSLRDGENGLVLAGALDSGHFFGMLARENTFQQDVDSPAFGYPLFFTPGVARNTRILRRALGGRADFLWLGAFPEGETPPDATDRQLLKMLREVEITPELSSTFAGIHLIEIPPAT